MSVKAPETKTKAVPRQEDLFINGGSRAAASGETFDDFNPTTGELYARVAKAGLEDARAAIEAAKAAARVWRDMPGAERERVLWEAATLLEKQGDAFVDTLVNESGSTLAKARGEVKKCVDFLRAGSGEVRRVEGTSMPSHKCSFSIRQPVGVVVAITPWNVPLTLSLKKVVLALSTGNTLVLKPASSTPVIALMMGPLFLEAGVPAGGLNVVPGPGKALGDLFATHPDVKTITFTGESATGKTLASIAAGHLKRFALELGGKNPAIVLADADLDHAVEAITFGAFHHQGQNCMSIDRVIVEEPLHDQLVERLVEKAGALRVGDPRLPETQLGPMIDKSQLESVHKLVAEAAEAGAEIVCGGEPDPPFYPPTVVTGVRPGMSLFEEETFGPVAPVIKAKDADDALALANNSRYGLAAAVFTRDIDRGLQFARDLESGMVHINDATIYTEATAPFGGVKDSGFGREGLGGWSWHDMTEPKWITVQFGRKKYPF